MGDFLLGLIVFIGIPILIYKSTKQGNINKKNKEVNLNFPNNSNALPYCLVFDTETTGLILDQTLKPTIANLKSNDSNFPKIVQISWSLFSRNREIISEGNYYIKQLEPIPEEAIKIHNITNEICKEKGVDLKEALLKLSNDCTECTAIVAHNLSFDKTIIEAEFIRLGLKKPFSNKTNYDTVKMGQSVMKQRKYPKLEELCVFLYGENIRPHLNQHNSLYDLFFTANCFFKMKSMKGHYWNK
jgi:DNA polymerase-3 subunit epsilon